MSETSHPVRPARDGGTTDDDRRTALRFVLGRPGWRAEAQVTAEGAAYLSVTTPCSQTGGRRSWRVARTGQGLMVHDETSGRRLGVAPTMREALVEIWEAATGAALD